MHRNHRHPLTLKDAIGEATVRLAERDRESVSSPSWPTACDHAFEARDHLIAAATHLGSLAYVPSMLDMIADSLSADPALHVR